MTERKSPTAVLHEGPRALTDAQVREIEESDLQAVRDVDIDDVIEYVHKDLKSLPDRPPGVVSAASAMIWEPPAAAAAERVITI